MYSPVVTRLFTGLAVRNRKEDPAYGGRQDTMHGEEEKGSKDEGVCEFRQDLEMEFFSKGLGHVTNVRAYALD